MSACIRSCPASQQLINYLSSSPTCLSIDTKNRCGGQSLFVACAVTTPRQKRKDPARVWTQVPNEEHPRDKKMAPNLISHAIVNGTVDIVPFNSTSGVNLTNSNNPTKTFLDSYLMVFGYLSGVLPALFCCKLLDPQLSNALSHFQESATAPSVLANSDASRSPRIGMVSPGLSTRYLKTERKSTLNLSFTPKTHLNL